MSQHRDETFDGTDHTAEDLSFSDYTGASFVGTNLSYTDLTNTCLENATLTGADLSNAIMVNTNFRNADLTRANLTNVNLAACDLRGARLDFAILTGADVTGIDPAVFGVQFGTGAGDVAEGDDSRFTDARTPTTHTHAESDITGLVSDLAGKAATSHTHSAADITDATATPTASKIVIASAGGKVDGWISDAAAGTKGLVDLSSVALVGDARLGGRIRQQENFFRSPLPQAAGSMFLESGYGYFVYIGQFLEAIMLNYINIHVSTAGAGSQTAEVGLFSTPLEPNRTGQTLTRLAATSGMTAMTAAGYHRNSTPLAYTPTVGVPVWAAIRTVMGTTRVLVRGLSFEMGQGAAFIKSAVGDLTSVSPVACTVQGHSTSSVGPDLWVTVA